MVLAHPGENIGRRRIDRRHWSLDQPAGQLSIERRRCPAGIRRHDRRKLAFSEILGELRLKYLDDDERAAVDDLARTDADRRHSSFIGWFDDELHVWPRTHRQRHRIGSGIQLDAAADGRRFGKQVTRQHHIDIAAVARPRQPNGIATGRHRGADESYRDDEHALAARAQGLVRQLRGYLARPACRDEAEQHRWHRCTSDGRKHNDPPPSAPSGYRSYPEANGS